MLGFIRSQEFQEKVESLLLSLQLKNENHFFFYSNFKLNIQANKQKKRKKEKFSEVARKFETADILASLRIQRI